MNNYSLYIAYGHVIVFVLVRDIFTALNTIGFIHNGVIYCMGSYYCKGISRNVQQAHYLALIDRIPFNTFK